jgi:deazaflavin-dependent oxidoreductase (nitroreductase family)
MPFSNRIRTINKRFTNRITGKIAGKVHSPIALLTHVGRRSGKTYSTPIMVGHNQGSFIFALTYGSEVDWYKNVLAAGWCELIWKGKEYHLVHPRQIGQTNGLKVFPNPQQFILKILKIQDFFEMDSSQNS